MLAALVVCFAALNAPAQTKTHNATTPAHKASHRSKAKSSKADSTAVLTNSNSYPALAAKPDATLRIADPVINTLNAKAAGATVPQSTLKMMGLPKYRNGFANGHILLRNTTASSSGTAFGSGAVGTGTSLHGVGAGESTLGTNGKSPYAGASLWGDKRPVIVKASDSARQQ